MAEHDGCLVLEFGGEAVCLEGRATRALLPALLPLLDGTRTLEEIVLVLGEPARAAIEAALVLLVENGVLGDGPPLARDVPAPFAAAARGGAAAWGGSAAAVRDRLARSAFAVAGAGATAAEVARLLRLSGAGAVASIGWDGPLDDVDVAVAAPAPGERPQLSDWNERLLETQTPWLQLLAFDGAFAAIGPLFVPRETCCYECYRRRRASNIDYPDEFWALERAPDRAPEAPPAVAAAAGLAVGFVLRWLLFSDPFVAGVLFALDLGHEPRLTPHVVYRVPRCPACSEVVRLAPPRPWAEAS